MIPSVLGRESRRRDADGGGRDDRAPKEVSKDWGLTAGSNQWSDICRWLALILAFSPREKGWRAAAGGFSGGTLFSFTANRDGFGRQHGSFPFANQGDHDALDDQFAGGEEFGIFGVFGAERGISTMAARCFWRGITTRKARTLAGSDLMKPLRLRASRWQAAACVLRKPKRSAIPWWGGRAAWRGVPLE
jgi:hypothetical protein